jgi:hypothetical protein
MALPPWKVVLVLALVPVLEIVVVIVVVIAIGRRRSTQDSGLPCLFLEFDNIATMLAGVTGTPLAHHSETFPAMSWQP